MSYSLPNHHNNCICCGSKIDGYWGSNDAGHAPAAFCSSCDGYPCYCHKCGAGAFKVHDNPRSYSIECPECKSTNAAVQVENGWE